MALVVDTRPRLALFDLDHTLLLGDSDELWCDHLTALGMLDWSFALRNQDVAARYKAGSIDVDEFAAFYLSTLAGRTPQQWAAIRQTYLETLIVPRIPQAALALVRAHREAGDTVVLTTATNRFLVELTAAHLGIEHLIATEPEFLDGVFTGRPAGVVNMRGGKPQRLQAWLAGRGQSPAQFRSIAHSDSMNDLPLLEMADEAVVVNGDDALVAIAAQRGWRTLAFSLP